MLLVGWLVISATSYKLCTHTQEAAAAVAFIFSLSLVPHLSIKREEEEEEEKATTQK
jgi:hypothetical protein